MNDLFKDIEKDIIEDFPHLWGKVDSVLDYYSEESFDCIPNIEGVEISISEEKVNSLQRNVCVEISIEYFSIELLYEDGINNGTQLNDYRVNSSKSFTQEAKEIEVLKDIKLDKEKTSSHGINMRLAQLVFDKHKSDILDMLRKKSYDNYVTGGGSNRTDLFYKSKMRDYENMGVFWVGVYEIQEVDSNFF